MGKKLILQIGNTTCQLGKYTEHLYQENTNQNTMKYYLALYTMAMIKELILSAGEIVEKLLMANAIHAVPW